MTTTTGKVASALVRSGAATTRRNALSTRYSRHPAFAAFASTSASASVSAAPAPASASIESSLALPLPRERLTHCKPVPRSHHQSSSASNSSSADALRTAAALAGVAGALVACSAAASDVGTSNDAQCEGGTLLRTSPRDTRSHYTLFNEIGRGGASFIALSSLCLSMCLSVCLSVYLYRVCVRHALSSQLTD